MRGTIHVTNLTIKDRESGKIMQESLKYAHDWLMAGHGVVLAIVTQTWGSAPRPVGSLMVVHADGHFEGSVSGGCIEGSVIAEAGALMHGSGSKTLDFAVSREDAWQIGLSCGGRIQIKLFPLGPQALEPISQALTALAARAHGTLHFAYHNDDISFSPTVLPQTSASPVEKKENCLSLAILVKPVLVIIGAVHISQELAPMALACGYDIVLIDPRDIFMAERQFGKAALIRDWPDDYLKTHPLDASSALVTLTHDPKIDDAALTEALKSQAFYIGALGSRKTHAARCARLKEAGFAPDQIGLIKGPVGLSIGAKSPAEIAVSIMADITQAYRGAGAKTVATEATSLTATGQ